MPHPVQAHASDAARTPFGDVDQAGWDELETEKRRAISSGSRSFTGVADRAYTATLSSRACGQAGSARD